MEKVCDCLGGPALSLRPPLAVSGLRSHIKVFDVGRTSGHSFSVPVVIAGPLPVQHSQHLVHLLARGSADSPVDSLPSQLLLKRCE